MTYVTTFIASEKAQPLTLPQGGQWLDQGIAYDVFHDNRQEWPALPGVDIITQETKHRRKTLLVADMDSTLIEQECIDEMAAHLGIKDQIAAITARAMNGELDFTDALEERVALLKGLSLPDLQAVFDERITMMPGAQTMAATMKKHGAHLVIVSGGFTFFTSLVRDELGFDDAYSNELEWRQGSLTGHVVPPIFDAESKLHHLKRLIKERDLEREATLAIGDGANDLPMLKAAGLGVACHAKPAVQAKCNAQLNHNNLSALLYVQGYTRSEWG